MARFWVEFINHGKVEGAQTVDAPSPLSAAQRAASGPVTLRQNETRWIRVTPVRKSLSYEFVRA
jgi:hypothetical protein